MATIQDVRDLHHHAWKTVIAKLGPMLKSFDEPACEFEIWKNGVAGKANSVWCKYNLAYVYTNSIVDYGPTVLHEIAHVAARRISSVRPKPHGDLFAWILRDTLGVKGQLKHSYNVTKAKLMVDLLRLQAKVA